MIGAAVVGWQLDETSYRAGFGSVHWLSAIPTPAPTPGLGSLFVLSLMCFGGRRCTPVGRVGKLLLRNRTWDARRATVGPHLAAISGKLRSLRVSAIGVCSTAPTERGILPSWSCEFDSRHPLQSIAPSQRAFTAPELFEHGEDKINQAGHLFS
jgi:hypothetical protein